MRCEDLDERFEGLADGSQEADGDTAAHVATCAVCAARLAEARAIEALLAAREVPAPPPMFTSAVMSAVRRDWWQAEQVVDIGFNLALAAGLLLVIGGAIGLAWSAGLFAADVDLRVVASALSFPFVDRVIAQAPTVAMAAALLVTTLGVWWWAEAGTAGL